MSNLDRQIEQLKKGELITEDEVISLCIKVQLTRSRKSSSKRATSSGCTRP